MFVIRTLIIIQTLVIIRILTVTTVRGVQTIGLRRIDDSGVNCLNKFGLAVSEKVYVLRTIFFTFIIVDKHL